MCLKLLVAILLSFSAISAFAQFRAGIQGVLVDPQGEVVGGATVTLTSKETNISKTVTSDATGTYNFFGLAPGHYTIAVEKTGFKKKTLDDVLVAAEQAQSFNISLEVGEVTQAVTVTAEVASSIDTETGQISSTLSTNEVQNLPSLGRDPFQLLRLAPGVFGDGAHAAGARIRSIVEGLRKYCSSMTTSIQNLNGGSSCSQPVPRYVTFNMLNTNSCLTLRRFGHITRCAT